MNQQTKLTYDTNGNLVSKVSPDITNPLSLNLYAYVESNPVFCFLRGKLKNMGIRLSQEALIQALISGYIPKPLPPLDYHALIRELRAIGNNLNQLEVKAHAIGHLEREVFQQEADQLRRAVYQIQKAVRP